MVGAETTRHLGPPSWIGALAVTALLLALVAAIFHDAHAEAYRAWRIESSGASP